MLKGFMLEYDGFLQSETEGFVITGETQIINRGDGSTLHIDVYKNSEGSIEVRSMVVTHNGLNIIEKWIEVKNLSHKAIKLTRVDSMHEVLPAKKYNLKYFKSTHGKEFTPVETVLEGTKILETTGGRSSEGTHPWFSVEGEDGSVLVCSIAWSGNWITRFEPVLEGSYRITGGLSNWNFSKVLKSDGVMEGIHIISTYLAEGDLDAAIVEFGKWGRMYWYPKNVLSVSSPVEWNPWYPYTDRYINEDVFKANVDKCNEVGIDVCTLDAGWFGLSDDESEWYYIRGDWHKINMKRFPSGMKSLADYTHSKGLKFGLWCEIEAVGEQAELNVLHPELIARRNESHLGYLCMGNPETVKWAFSVLETLITDYGVDWIKLDFNISPGAGCNRTDHGHGEGDGLYEHYIGYYHLLDMVRERYPRVLLENCSGGGLRTDLGIMKRTHLSFLSDPDYPTHAFQVFWGATTMLHPSICLHWSWSQTTSDHLKNGDNNPIKNDMSLKKFDYIVRNALLKNPGFSYKLNEFPQWCLERLTYHIEFYKSTVKNFIKEADFYRLTCQTIRTGEGDGWNSYLYITEDKCRALLFVFRLPNGEKERIIKLKGLDSDSNYSLQFQDKDLSFVKKGRELIEDGITFDGMDEESSDVVTLQKL